MILLDGSLVGQWHMFLKGRGGEKIGPGLGYFGRLKSVHYQEEILQGLM